MSQPTAIKLSDEDAALLARLNAREGALGDMTRNFQNQFEARAEQLRMDTRALWQSMSQKYNLNMEKVLWAVSPDGLTLVPQQMKLV